MRNHRKRYQFMIQTGLLLIWLRVSPVYQAKDQAQSGEVSRSELILANNTLHESQGLPPLIENPIVNAVSQATAEIMAATWKSM